MYFKFQKIEQDGAVRGGSGGVTTPGLQDFYNCKCNLRRMGALQRETVFTILTKFFVLNVILLITHNSEDDRSQKV